MDHKDLEAEAGISFAEYTLNIAYKGFRKSVEYLKTLKILKILSTGDPYNTLNFWPHTVDRGRCSRHSKPKKNAIVSFLCFNHKILHGIFYDK